MTEDGRPSAASGEDGFWQPWDPYVLGGGRNWAAESSKAFARLFSDPEIGVRFESAQQRCFDADGEWLPVWLAHTAAECVDGMATNLGDRVGELREDGFEVRLVSEVIHELKTPPTDLRIRMIEPRDQRGSGFGLHTDTPKVIGVDRANEIEDRLIAPLRIGERTDEVRERFHSSRRPTDRA